MNAHHRSLTVLLALIAPATAVAQDGGAATAAGVAVASAGRDMDTQSSSRLSASVGITDWRGDFGGPTTSAITALAPGVRFRDGNLRLSVLVPWMRIRSDSVIFAGVGGTPLAVSPTAAPTRRTRDGFGDATLGASYLLPSSSFDVELIGRIKVPLSSGARSVSTGKVDYYGGVEVSKTIGGFTPAVQVTYRVFGDMAGWDLRNGFATSVSGTFLLGRRVTALVSYDYAEAATRFIGDSHELAVGLSTPIADNRLRLTGFASAGLSRGAPDRSIGASVTFNF